MNGYIENIGYVKSVFNDNKHNDKQITEWNANYDGKNAKIKINTYNNGKKNKYRMKLNNRDLEKILTFPAIDKSLENRLKEDFLDNDSYDLLNNNAGEYDFLNDNELYLIDTLEKKEDKENKNFECYHPNLGVKPEPNLFRVNIPYSKHKKMLLKSPYSRPCGCKSNICNHKLNQIILLPKSIRKKNQKSKHTRKNKKK